MEAALGRSEVPVVVKLGNAFYSATHGTLAVLPPYRVGKGMSRWDSGNEEPSNLKHPEASDHSSQPRDPKLDSWEGIPKERIYPFYRSFVQARLSTLRACAGIADLDRACKVSDLGEALTWGLRFEQEARDSSKGPAYAKLCTFRGQERARYALGRLNNLKEQTFQNPTGSALTQHYQPKFSTLPERRSTLEDLLSIVRKWQRPVGEIAKVALTPEQLARLEPWLGATACARILALRGEYEKAEQCAQNLYKALAPLNEAWFQVEGLPDEVVSAATACALLEAKYISTMVPNYLDESRRQRKEALDKLRKHAPLIDAGFWAQAEGRLATITTAVPLPQGLAIRSQFSQLRTSLRAE